MRKMIVAAVAAALALALAAPAVAAKPSWAEAAKPGDSSIVDIVISNPDVVGDSDGDFDVLLAAVLAANPAVLSELGDKDQHTVFAPTDDAFMATLGAANEGAAIATVQSLPQGDLTEILLFHVMNGRRHSNSVLAAKSYQMLNGDKLTQGELAAAGLLSAPVLVDISASNGTIHVLTEGVLLP